MTTMSGASGRRWLKSVLLALCVDAAGMGLAGILLESTPASVAGSAPDGLRVRLGPALSESRMAAARLQAPASAPPVPALAPTPIPALVPTPIPIPVQEAGPTFDSVQPLQEWNASRLPDSDADSGADLRQSVVSGRGTTGPELLQRVEALVRENLAYPPLARKRSIEGVVRLSLLIGKDGRLTKVVLAGSSGSSILDKAAMTLVEGIFPLGLMYELDDEVAIGIRVAYSLTS